MLDSPEFAKRVIQPGTNCWTIQTYLKLRERGHDVSITPSFMHDAINIAHYDSIPAYAWLRHFFVVSIRADRDPTFIANLEITQNASSTTRGYQHFISLWPQPALMPRDPHRGHKIETLCFMGVPENLAASFKTREFENALNANGIRLVVERNNWWDYREIDAVLAVRDGSPYFLQHKPASKLVNSWLAGCPALLGPEPAYREIGRSGIDYFEVSQPKDVLSVLRLLHEQPGLFEKIVRNGQDAVRAYGTDAVIRQWENFLFGPATQAYFDWKNNFAMRAPQRFLKLHYRLLKRRLWGYQYYKNCDENGRLLPRTLLGKLRHRLIKP